MYKEAVYKELHTNVGHYGVDRTLQLTKNRFYWQKMEKDIRYTISNICPCVRQEKPNIHAATPRATISSSSPLEIIGIDFLHLEKSSGTIEYILLLTDHFTRYIQANPTRNKTAKTAANHLYNNFILKLRIPTWDTKLLYGQGGVWERNI